MNIVGSGSFGRFSVATIPPLCVSISIIVREKDDIWVETLFFTDLVLRFSISFFFFFFHLLKEQERIRLGFSTVLRSTKMGSS